MMQLTINVGAMVSIKPMHNVAFWVKFLHDRVAVWLCWSCKNRKDIMILQSPEKIHTIRSHENSQAFLCESQILNLCLTSLVYWPVVPKSTTKSYFRPILYGSVCTSVSSRSRSKSLLPKSYGSDIFLLLWFGGMMTGAGGRVFLCC